jgi:hypothetical protein
MKDSLLMLVSETGKVIGHTWFDMSDAVRGSIEIEAKAGCENGRLFLASNLIPNHILDITNQVVWEGWARLKDVLEGQTVNIKNINFTDIKII